MAIRNRAAESCDAAPAVRFKQSSTRFKIGPIGASIMAVLYLGALAGFAGRAWHAHALRRDIDRFVETRCVPRPSRAEHESHKYHDDTYRFVLACGYEVGGVTYEADDALGHDYTYESSGAAIHAGDQRMKTAPPPVYYDPVEPARAVLSRHVAPFSWLSLLPLILFGGLGTLALAGLVRLSILALRRRRAARAAAEAIPPARVINS